MLCQAVDGAEGQHGLRAASALPVPPAALQHRVEVTAHQLLCQAPVAVNQHVHHQQPILHA